MKRYLEIHESNFNEKDLVKNWLSTCKREKRPCVLVYYHDGLAHITASIDYLVKDKTRNLGINEKLLDREFFFLGIKYFQSSLHFWSINDAVFTFDDVPKEQAPAAAVEIFPVLEKVVS